VHVRADRRPRPQGDARPLHPDRQRPEASLLRFACRRSSGRNAEFVFDLVGDDEPLVFDPVNFWTGTLIFAIALDLGSLHAVPAGRGKRR
jgi:hypothetical protein